MDAVLSLQLLRVDSQAVGVIGCLSFPSCLSQASCRSETSRIVVTAEETASGLFV